MLSETDVGGLDRFLAGSGKESSRVNGHNGIFAVGTMLGVWRIETFVGHGGSGEVYRVINSVTLEPAAAKVLTRNDEATKKRFRDEIDFLAQNQFPQFPRYFERGELDGRAYVVLELLEPLGLPSTEKGVADYLLAVCACVGALHRFGIIHRDLKPANIMRRKNGEVVLIDFGLAKDVRMSTGPRADVSVVSSKVVGVGTLDYAAPEQLTGGEISPATDIHALGRIANTAFGGKPPRAWAAIIRRATSSIAAQRYETIEAFASAIRARNRGRRCLIGCVAAAALIAVSLLYSGLFGTDRSQALRDERPARAPESAHVGGETNSTVDVSSPSNAANPIGTVLGDPQRVWWSDGKPSVEGQIVEWRVNNHGKAVGRDVYVGSSGATAGIATSCLYTKITGPCKIHFEYRIGTYNGQALVLCDKQELMHFKGIADASFGWKEAEFDISEGEHLLSFVYIHPGIGFIKQFNGFLLSKFQVIPSR